MGHVAIQYENDVAIVVGYVGKEAVALLNDGRPHASTSHMLWLTNRGNSWSGRKPKRKDVKHIRKRMNWKKRLSIKEIRKFRSTTVRMLIRSHVQQKMRAIYGKQVEEYEATNPNSTRAKTTAKETSLVQKARNKASQKQVGNKSKLRESLLDTNKVWFPTGRRDKFKVNVGELRSDLKLRHMCGK